MRSSPGRSSRGASRSETMPGSSPTWSGSLDVYASEHTEEEPLILHGRGVAKQMTEDVEPPIGFAPGRAGQARTTTTSVGACVRSSCSSTRSRANGGSRPRQPNPGGLGRGGPRLLDEDYPERQAVKLVCDNLNTHTIASLYEAFPAAEGAPTGTAAGDHPHALQRQLVEMGGDRTVGAGRKPVPGPPPPRRRRLTPSAAWETARNAEGSRVVWRFTTADARIKLKHLYPQI